MRRVEDLKWLGHSVSWPWKREYASIERLDLFTFLAEYSGTCQGSFWARPRCYSAIVDVLIDFSKGRGH